MEYIKTVTTESTETAITFTDFYPYVWLRNYGETDVLVSAYPDIVSGEDEVAVLKAASAICVPAQSESVYVLGATTIEAHAQDYDASPWTASGGNGGSGGGSTKYIGTTTTALSNGSTTNPITVNGESYTAQFGDIAVYNYTEFVFDGTAWSEFGRNYDTTPTSGSANAVTSNGIYELIHRGTGDISTVIGSSNTASATCATAMGNGNTASGGYATAMGSNTTASSAYATAMGGGTTASGNYATAMGSHTTASKHSSLAAGYYTEANQTAMTAIGKYNSPRTGDLFNIGNGSENTRSNIVEVNSTSMNVNGAITQNNTPVLVNAGTLPSLTYDSTTEALTFSAGTLPSGGTT